MHHGGLLLHITLLAEVMIMHHGRATTLLLTEVTMTYHTADYVRHSVRQDLQPQPCVIDAVRSVRHRVRGIAWYRAVPLMPPQHTGTVRGTLAIVVARRWNTIHIIITTRRPKFKDHSSIE